MLPTTLVRASSLVALLTLACVSDPPKTAEAGAEAGAKETESAKPVDPKALTPEEQALIAADPQTLTPEQRRKRGYALRKKIMQNPDSDAAKALEDARKAVEAGELEITAPGDPKKPADNGVVIPAPDFLKNQDQSVGKPAE